MARPLFWLGIPTTTTAVVMVRAVTNGTVTVTVDGNDFTAVADTAVKDGLVKITATGLSADTKYPYTVTLPDTDSGSNTLKTFPASGDAVIAHYTCATGRDDPYFRRLDERDPHCVICTGDFGYFSSSEAYNGDSSSGIAGGSTDIADYHDCYRVRHSLPSFRRLCEKIPFANVPDDHEGDINNLDWNEISGTLTIADAIVQGSEDYMQGNPVNADSPGDTNPFYFRFECGDAEVFVLCAVIHGNDPADVQHMYRDSPGADTGCYGRDAAGSDIRNQEDWLVAKILASTKTYKVVLSPKQSLKSTFTNQDAWTTYPTERDRVIQAVHDSGAKGVIWGSGDWHSPGIYAATNGVDGETYDHVVIAAGSHKGDVRDSGADSIYTVFSYQGTQDEWNWFYTGMYGVFEADATRITGRIFNMIDNELANASVLAGSNAIE